MISRLQKIISDRGYCSRRQAEKLIFQGVVKVDGKIIRELGSSFENDCDISIFNKPLKIENEKVYLLFNKPRCVITTMYDPKKRKTVHDFFINYPKRVYPVGRLDYDVSGLLIMTNDGELSQFLSHPKYGFSKTYQALCDGKINKNQVKQLEKGVKINGDYLTKAVFAELSNFNETKNESIVVLQILEGKKHHVKEMLMAADIKLKKLKRTHIEFLSDENLNVGEYRNLTTHEVRRLYGIYKSKKINN